MKQMSKVYFTIPCLAAFIFADLFVHDILSNKPNGYTYNPVGDSILEITNYYGLIGRKDLTNISIRGHDISNHKVINMSLDEVDTSDFAQKINYLMTLPIGNENSPLIAGDSDKDGLVELVGHYQSEMPNSLSTKIYERISAGRDEFQEVYTYPWIMKPILSADINANGHIEYWFWKTADHQDDYFAYESLADGELAILPIIHLYRGGSNFSIPRIADFDGDGRHDMVHNGGDGRSFFEAVAEYNSETRSMSNVWRHPSVSSPVGKQWAVGDFDGDGRMEFVNGHMHGIVFWYEHDGSDNGYQQVFHDTLFYKNVYYNTEGNEIDGDGRMEVFLGGGSFYQNIWTNFITCFETVGNNRFEKTVELRIRGMGGLNEEFITQGDVDGDGVNELVFSAGNSVTVIKNSGDDNYIIWWYKHFPRWIGATTADIDYDGDAEILVSYGVAVPNTTITQTEIYSFHETSAVIASENENTTKQIDFTLKPNYPNPFYPATTFYFSLPEAGHALMTIHNVLGQQVVLLADEYFPAGSQSVRWNGRDALGLPVPAGVYFCRVRFRDRAETSKFSVVR